MEIKLLVYHGKKYYQPEIIDEIQWSTERSGSAGKLSFKIFKDGIIQIAEGDPIRLKVDGDKVFYGFVFTIKHDTDALTITAYDQMRYLKNKATYKYSLTATQLLKKIAKDFNLKTGDVADTKYKIPSRVEDGKTLLDIMKNALDLTLVNTGDMFYLYDNYGKLEIKNINKSSVNLMIDEETAQSFDYQSSIDSKTYNQIKLYRDNKKTGQRDIFIQKDSKSINKWGVLQYYEKLDDNENGKNKAQKLLKLYNAVTRTLTIKDAFGDNRVRAGTMIYVRMTIDDLKLDSYMLVETCTHTYKENEHYMTMKLRGGVING